MVERRKADRAETISRMSRELANSGNYAGWLDIEMALRAQGYSEARTQLDNRYVRGELDALCKAAKARKAKDA